VAKNRVEVFPAMVPPLLAGRYELHLDQQMDAVGGTTPLGDVADEVRDIEITAPRVAMSGTELFSTYPPPNASGPFSTRLPQAALRRRTLPWERGMPPPPAGSGVSVNPWLALVVVTADEATFLTGLKAPDAFTPAVATSLGIVDDGSRADAIELTRTGVHQIFPRKDELHLLAHVRKVDVHDSELAGNDDDGWVAVLLSNRLPQPGLAYRVCVVSLEGQFAALADPQAAVDDKPSKASLYADLDPILLQAATFTATGSPVPLGATDQPALAPAGLLSGARAKAPDAWVQATGSVRASTTSGPISAHDIAVAAFGGGFVRPELDLRLVEPEVPRFRFPVLASWEFVCEGSGDFESLMQNLDVGLLGTLPAPDDAATGPAPVVLESGHAEIDHRRRRGVSGQAWYRGPLTPREVARRPATVPFAVADQARRVATDGLEDLSEAAAFEIGRLLALASPRFVAALRSWARDGFVIRRTRRRLSELGLLGRPDLELAPSLAGLDLLSRLARDDARVLGPQVPIVDLGSLADQAQRIDPVTLATGLGLDVKFVDDVLKDRPTTIGLEDVPTVSMVTDADRIAKDPKVVAHLGSALHEAVSTLSEGAGTQGVNE
jgi:hypothetical protein